MGDNILTGWIPLYGTWQDVKKAYNNPSLENIGWAAVSGLGDVLLFTGLGAGIKALKAAKAMKALKAANKSKRATKLLESKNRYLNAKMNNFNGDNNKEVKSALLSLKTRMDNYKLANLKNKLALQYYRDIRNGELIKLGKNTGQDMGLNIIEEVSEKGMPNFIGFNKNGSKIHIKKENRGKFTDYCGGKVTDKCILKGKNSKDPKIRKRATFAANARAWSHEEGAKIHKPFGHRSILDNGWRTTKQLKDKKIPIGEEGIPGVKKIEVKKREVKPLPYGVTFRFIKSLENPKDRGIESGMATFYDKKTAGYGTDVSYRSKEFIDKINNKEWTVKEARDLAVTDMRKNDLALMKLITKYTNRPDTISVGPRLLMALARYLYGNLRESFPEWGKAVAEGDADKLKEIALRLAKPYKSRYDELEKFNIYGTK